VAEVSEEVWEVEVSEEVWEVRALAQVYPAGTVAQGIDLLRPSTGTTFLTHCLRTMG